MAEGKPPKCIHIYNKKGIGTIGTYIYIWITLHSIDPKLVKWLWDVEHII
jgi:hypothetical protein